MTELHSFDSREALEIELADRIIALLEKGISERGMGALVVSGGRTPAGLFQKLSLKDIDWSKVIVTLADERWVPEDHADSNASSVKKHLLQNHAVSARFIPHVTSAKTPHLGCEDLEKTLQELPKTLDAVILGMGEDGHTASFFPKAPELAAAIDPHNTHACMGVTPPVAPYLRMTLSLPRLLAAKQIFLHLCGDGKMPVLSEAMGEGPVEDMPIRAVLRQSQTPIAVYWAP